MKYKLKALCRWLFVVLVAWPICLVVLGMNIRHRNRLPRHGPAIVTPNHNSHLDTLAMLTLFPLSLIPKVRPVAAADYFLKTGLMGWFSLNFVGIIPIARKRGADNEDPLEACYEALRRGEILIIFPEGTRGEPERISVTVQGHLRASNSEVLRDAAVAGLGVALLPDFSAAAALRARRLRVLLPAWRPVGVFGDAIYAMHPWSPTTPKAVQALVAHLRASLGAGFEA